MTRLAALLISASLFAGAAFAQPAAVPTAGGVGDSPAAVTPALPQSKAPAPGHEVSGVVVPAQPKSLSSCHERDNACITAVVAELKQRYPEQLRRWCNNQKDMANRANLQAGDVIMGTQFHGPQERNFDPPEVTKIACADDKKK
jgi:hypothetical protein